MSATGESGHTSTKSATIPPLKAQIAMAHVMVRPRPARRCTASRGVKQKGPLFAGLEVFTNGSVEFKPPPPSGQPAPAIPDTGGRQPPSNRRPT
jgi:hypothetical protein